MPTIPRTMRIIPVIKPSVCTLRGAMFEVYPHPWAHNRRHTTAHKNCGRTIGPKVGPRVENEHLFAYTLLLRSGRIDYRSRSSPPGGRVWTSPQWSNLLCLSLIHISEPTRLRRISYA